MHLVPNILMLRQKASQHDCKQLCVDVTYKLCDKELWSPYWKPDRETACTLALSGECAQIINFKHSVVWETLNKWEAGYKPPKWHILTQNQTQCVGQCLGHFWLPLNTSHTVCRMMQSSRNQGYLSWKPTGLLRSAERICFPSTWSLNRRRASSNVALCPAFPSLPRTKPLRSASRWPD